MRWRSKIERASAICCNRAVPETSGRVPHDRTVDASNGTPGANKKPHLRGGGFLGRAVRQRLGYPRRVRGLFDRHVRGLRTAKDLVDIFRAAPQCALKVRT